MVQLYRPAKKPKKPAQRLELEIDALDAHGCGVARHQGQVVFVEDALPGERVLAKLSQQKKRLSHGQTIKVLTPSPERVTPFCPHFAACGGCQRQYSQAEFLLAQKQRALDAQFKRQLGLNSLPWQAAIISEPQGYRRKARLALDCRKKPYKLGFKGEKTNQVIAVEHCGVLVPSLAALIAPLQTLLENLQQPRHIGHITLTAGDNHVQVAPRLIKAPTAEEQQRWQAFAIAQQVQVLLQAPDAELLLGPIAAPLSYNLLGLTLQMGCDDFIQVNAEVNRAMVAQAIDWLDLKQSDQLLDLFCGLGNFSLPLARRVARVTGVEVVAKMVARARANAQLNGMANTEFVQANLDEAAEVQPLLQKDVNKIVLDPARAGASALMPLLAKARLERILYVSCNPASFARDAAVLLKQGWRLNQLAVMDMFPQTQHIELMACFIPEPN